VAEPVSHGLVVASTSTGDERIAQVRTDIGVVVIGPVAGEVDDGDEVTVVIGPDRRAVWHRTLDAGERMLQPNGGLKEPGGRP
jgi:hypothetical protein